MPFNSYSYLLLLAVAVAAYWQLPRRFRGAYLLAVSVLYYATWNVGHIAIPLSLCFLVWLISRHILINAASDKRWLLLGVTLVLVVLGFFKYRQFLLEASGALLAPLELRPISFAVFVALPLGISFYSFEAISYLIDVQQRRTGKHGFLDLCNFIMFWPHLMAGPIVRVRELVPQLHQPQTFQWRFLVAGLDRIIWGLVQKNAIANPIGSWVDQGFKPDRFTSTADAWFLALGFGLQIYFDFAGYSNMAIGAARLLGITLPENFRFPYHATTPPDFWSRWHMTLSRWIRDYLFFPLNARFHGAPLPLYTSLLGVMALVGLWHGAGWGFVLWGLAHGVYLVLFRIYESLVPEPLRRSPVATFAWRLFTLGAVTAAWVLFRAASLAQAGTLFHAMFLSFVPGWTLPDRFYYVSAFVALLCVLEPFVVHFLAGLEKGALERGRALTVALALTRSLAYAGGLILFMIFDEEETLFIYFQF